MAQQSKGRYSKYIRPIGVIIDLILLNFWSYFFLDNMGLNIFHFFVYQTCSWLVLSFLVGFYKIYRFTTPVEILTKIFKQISIFSLLVIAYFPFANEFQFHPKEVAIFINLVFISVVSSKYFFFIYLKKYRLATGNNYRNTVIIGYTEEAKKLKRVFDSRPDYGYRFFGYFSDKKTGPEIIGKTEDASAFILENKIDEIYCSLNELKTYQMKDLVDFVDENNLQIKFIPDSNQILSKNLKIDYYEFFPVLSFQKTQLHDPVIKVLKRSFDIFFSLFVIVFILSWLTPILTVLIIIESKGPVIFKQGRPGLGEKEFFCYKFRSMKLNHQTEIETFKNDPRVTRIGKFLRKTSIDEMPQFYNVLLGDMSVVGPRPHLWSQNKNYASRIKKYMVRHYVKPGITGLAQVKGYRGEIETDEDMVNRIKYDVFYIENWSFVLDIKIIIQTVVNIFKGDEKAY